MVAVVVVVVLAVYLYRRYIGGRYGRRVELVVGGGTQPKQEIEGIDGEGARKRERKREGDGGRRERERNRWKGRKTKRG